MASKPQLQPQEFGKIKIYLVNTLVRDLESTRVPFNQRQNISKTGVTFLNDDHVMQLIHRIPFPLWPTSS